MHSKHRSSPAQRRARQQWSEWCSDHAKRFVEVESEALLPSEVLLRIACVGESFHLESSNHPYRLKVQHNRPWKDFDPDASLLHLESGCILRYRGPYLSLTPTLVLVVAPDARMYLVSTECLEQIMEHPVSRRPMCRGERIRA